MNLVKYKCSVDDGGVHFNRFIFYKNNETIAIFSIDGIRTDDNNYNLETYYKINNNCRKLRSLGDVNELVLTEDFPFDFDNFELYNDISYKNYYQTINSTTLKFKLNNNVVKLIFISELKIDIDLYSVYTSDNFVKQVKLQF